MRAHVIQGSFGLEQLCLIDRPSSPPGPGQVRVGLRCVSLNYRDLMTVRGDYNPRQPLPLVPCSDGAGVVLELGEGVSELKVGDRVMTVFAQDWLGGEPERSRLRSTLGGPRDGTLQEDLILPAHGVVPVPEHLSDAEASTLPCAALTAWSALITLGNVRPGQTVLVQGSGGVSLFALQLARLAGAQVIATSSSDDKLERMLALGASHGINYKKVPKWGREVSRISGGGVDVVVEVGGAGTLEQSLQAVRLGGTISLIGVLAGGMKDLSIVPVFMNQVRIQGIMVGSRDGMLAMCRAIAVHGLRPVIDSSFEFEQARAAFEHMASASHFGKIVVKVTD